MYPSTINLKGLVFKTLYIMHIYYTRKGERRGKVFLCGRMRIFHKIIIDTKDTVIISATNFKCKEMHKFNVSADFETNSSNELWH